MWFGPRDLWLWFILGSGSTQGLLLLVYILSTIWSNSYLPVHRKDLNCVSTSDQIVVKGQLGLSRLALTLKTEAKVRPPKSHGRGIQDPLGMADRLVTTRNILYDSAWVINAKACIFYFLQRTI